MSNVEFKEIETKYRAADIKLSDFRNIALTLKPSKCLEVSGYDHYYTKRDDKDCFIRYRSGDRPEATMKKKSKDTNNFVRTEVNLRLDTHQNKDEQLRTVKKFCNMLEFEHNFSIFKNCSIYFYDKYNVVYYVVYDDELKEKDRFIEIEMFEDAAWATEEEAWNELLKIEQLMKPLGISPQSRIRKSLYEMFVK